MSHAQTTASHAPLPKRPIWPIARDYKRRTLGEQITYVEDRIRRIEDDLDARKTHKDAAAWPLWNLRSLLLTLRDLQAKQTPSA